MIEGYVPLTEGDFVVHWSCLFELVNSVKPPTARQVDMTLAHVAMLLDKLADSQAANSSAFDDGFAAGMTAHASVDRSGSPG